MKDLEVISRYEKKHTQLLKNIDDEKDIYWKRFLSHKNVLERTGYLENNFPTEKGYTCAAVRAENELFLSEVIISGVLNNLSAAEIAGAVCALTTEDLRTDVFTRNPISEKTRKALNQIKDIRKKIAVVQRDYDITTEMYINSYYSPLIEMWVNGCEWEVITSQIDSSEGDIVRAFKRTVDVLRQLTIVPNATPSLSQIAKDSITAILREPIDID